MFCVMDVGGENACLEQIQSSVVCLVGFFFQKGMAVILLFSLIES